MEKAPEQDQGDIEHGTDRCFGLIGQDGCFLVADVVTNFGRIGHRQNGYAREQSNPDTLQMMPITKATTLSNQVCGKDRHHPHQWGGLPASGSGG
jgi:hypothetical protein